MPRGQTLPWWQRDRHHRRRCIRLQGRRRALERPPRLRSARWRRMARAGNGLPRVPPRPSPRAPFRQPPLPPARQQTVPGLPAMAHAARWGGASRLGSSAEYRAGSLASDDGGSASDRRPPRPFARIRAIETTRALALPGVFAVLTGNSTGAAEYVTITSTLSRSRDFCETVIAPFGPAILNREVTALDPAKFA